MRSHHHAYYYHMKRYMWQIKILLVWLVGKICRRLTFGSSSACETGHRAFGMLVNLFSWWNLHKPSLWLIESLQINTLPALPTKPLGKSSCTSGSSNVWSLVVVLVVRHSKWYSVVTIALIFYSCVANVIFSQILIVLTQIDYYSLITL